MINETLKFTKPHHYDKSKVFKEQIYPLLTKVYELCLEHGIPMFCQVEYSVGEDETGEPACLASNSKVVTDGKGGNIFITLEIMAFCVLSALLKRYREGDITPLISACGRLMYEAVKLSNELAEEIAEQVNK